jgi:hypothetical protein
MAAGKVLKGVGDERQSLEMVSGRGKNHVTGQARYWSAIALTLLISVNLIVPAGGRPKLLMTAAGHS